MTATANNKTPRGYHRLADLMGPYQSAAIFRRFGPLSMLNLLSLQAELVELDADFRDRWKTDDQSSDANEKNFSIWFRALRDSESGGNAAQYQMLLKIRSILAEYNEALLQAAQVAKLSRPTEDDVEFLRNWLGGDKEGGGFLKADEYFTYEPSDRKSASQRKALHRDLVTINPQPSEQDIFSAFMTRVFLYWWHVLNTNYLKYRQEAWNERHAVDDFSGTMHYEDSRIARASTIIVSVIASALPVLSIVALYYIKTTIQRIGAVVAFTVVFAFALALFTNARRIEIFATTSTFAAVEVVFIGTVLQGAN